MITGLGVHIAFLFWVLISIILFYWEMKITVANSFFFILGVVQFIFLVIRLIFLYNQYLPGYAIVNILFIVLGLTLSIHKTQDETYYLRIFDSNFNFMAVIHVITTSIFNGFVEYGSIYLINKIE